jgi:glycosyltransferase involved in cell wall biosynthesis
MRRLLFWLLAGIIAWTYAGFPLVVLARGRWSRRPVLAADICPTVSIVIAAHNEAPVIRRRVENLIGLDYPADRLEVIVASDGSTDATAAIAAAVAPDRVRVLELDRVGKADALNAALAEATGEIVVFSDANSEFAPDALRRLIRPFADPAGGGVAGDQRYRDDVDAGHGAGERQSWEIDRWLKQAESAAGNVISATGAIYAIRRELFRPVPAGVTDDFITSTAVIAQGRRLVFAGDAIAYEPVARDDRAEFGRKVRVMTRGLRGVVLRRALLDPRRSGFYAVQLATHKVLRRIVAFPFIGLALLTPMLWRKGPIYRLAALGQGAGYSLAALGLLLADRPLGRRKVLAIPAFFVLANAAAIQAVTNVLRGRRIDRWDPNVARSVQATAVAEAPGTGTDPVETAGSWPEAGGPVLSIVVPVNAQGDLDNVLALLDDLDAYGGTHPIETVLVVNNFPPDAPPVDAVADLERRGTVVLAIPALRRPGEAIGFSARIPGARAATSPWLVSFDADCRIPDATSLLDWYVEAFRDGASGAYSHVGYRDIRPGLSIKARLAAHHGARWLKRNLLHIPTVRGSNYGIRRDLLLQLYDDGLLADDMNVGPTLRHFGHKVAYSGDRRHVVLTSGRMFRGGWRKLGRYLAYRLRYNRRVLPVREGAARRTGRERDRDRTFVDNQLQ